MECKFCFRDCHTVKAETRYKNSMTVPAFDKIEGEIACISCRKKYDDMIEAAVTKAKRDFILQYQGEKENG